MDNKKNNHHKKQTFRRTGLTLGIVSVCFMTLFMIFMMGLGQGNIDDYLLFVILPAGISIGSLITALKWSLVGGALLLCEGLFIIIWFIARSGTKSIEFNFFIVCFICLPLLSSGLCFVKSWLYGRSVKNS